MHPIVVGRVAVALAHHQHEPAATTHVLQSFRVCICFFVFFFASRKGDDGGPGEGFGVDGPAVEEGHLFEDGEDGGRRFGLGHGARHEVKVAEAAVELVHVADLLQRQLARLLVRHLRPRDEERGVTVKDWSTDAGLRPPRLVANSARRTLEVDRVHHRQPLSGPETVTDKRGRHLQRVGHHQLVSLLLCRRRSPTAGPGLAPSALCVRLCVCVCVCVRTFMWYIMSSLER